MGFYVTDERERSNAVTTVMTGAIDAEQISRVTREQAGVTLGVGIGDLAGPSFRIGHMGHVNAHMVLGVLGSVEAAMISLGHPPTASGVAAAAAAIGAAF